MKIRAFLLADAVAHGEAGKFFVHGGGVNHVGADSFPLTLPQLSVLLRLEPDKEVPGTDHEVGIALGSPKGEVLAELKTPFRVPSPEDPDLPITLNFVSGFNGLTFPESGVYQFIATVDRDELDRIPLLVAQG